MDLFILDIPWYWHTRPEGHASHSKTSASPERDENVPAGHATQLTEFASERYVPGAQTVGMYVPYDEHE